jgi:hypothetical protein
MKFFLLIFSTTLAVFHITLSTETQGPT